METATLAAIVADTGATLYRDRYHSNPTAAAQDQLSGRTHYADPTTLRYFRSRIINAAPVADGLLFRIIESASMDPDHTRRGHGDRSWRGFRFVVFDVWGWVVERPALDDMVRTSDKARAAFYDWLGTFDVTAYYSERMAQERTKALVKAERYTAALDKFTVALCE